MGRKLKDSPTAEPEPALESSPNPEIKAEKKKKKKHKDNEEDNPKRKLQETEPQEAQKNEKKKKPKTHEGKVEPQRNDSVDDGETVRDELVVVTGKNVQSAKYAPLKSFAESGLSEEVLECCKNFQSPSLIQSRAWPFLLDDRDFIGIAKTGSGNLFDF